MHFKSTRDDSQITKYIWNIFDIPSTLQFCQDDYHTDDIVILSQLPVKHKNHKELNLVNIIGKQTTIEMWGGQLFSLREPDEGILSDYGIRSLTRKTLFYSESHPMVKRVNY
jgi:hypothetical protein